MRRLEEGVVIGRVAVDGGYGKEGGGEVRLHHELGLDGLDRRGAIHQIPNQRRVARPQPRQRRPVLGCQTPQPQPAEEPRQEPPPAPPPPPPRAQPDHRHPPPPPRQAEDRGATGEGRRAAAAVVGREHPGGGEGERTMVKTGVREGRWAGER
ncbi:unnamed protein product, partial [Musa acuminata var. zebrina]